MGEGIGQRCEGGMEWLREGLREGSDRQGVKEG